MEKLVNALKVALIIFILLVLAVIGILIYETETTERNYGKVLSYMDKGDWDSALELVKQIPHYKDASEIYIFAYPNKAYYNSYKDDNERIEGFKDALSFLKANKDKLKGEKSSKYLSELLELEKVLNFKVVQISAREQDISMKYALNDAVAMIKQGNLQGALTKLQSLSNDYIIEKTELTAYINFLNAVKTNDEAVIAASIIALNPGYTGILSEEIKTNVQAHMDINKWISMYKPPENPVQSFSVDIGIKKADVIQRLGNPLKVNTISNKFGIFEELVYGNKTIYIENDIVSGIK